eukprot:gene8981-biopygen1636
MDLPAPRRCCCRCCWAGGDKGCGPTAWIFLCEGGGVDRGELYGSRLQKISQEYRQGNPCAAVPRGVPKPSEGHAIFPPALLLLTEAPFAAAQLQLSAGFSNDTVLQRGGAGAQVYRELWEVSSGISIELSHVLQRALGPVSFESEGCAQQRRAALALPVCRMESGAFASHRLDSAEITKKNHAGFRRNLPATTFCTQPILVRLLRTVSSRFTQL